MQICAECEECSVGSEPALRMSHPRKKGFGSGLFGAISFAIATIRVPKDNENNGFAVFDVDFDAN